MKATGKSSTARWRPGRRGRAVRKKRRNPGACARLERRVTAQAPGFLRFFRTARPRRPGRHRAVLLLPVAFKLTVSFNRSEQILSGQPAYVVTFNVYSLGQRPFPIKNRRCAEATERNAAWAVPVVPKPYPPWLGFKKVLCWCTVIRGVRCLCIFTMLLSVNRVCTG